MTLDASAWRQHAARLDAAAVAACVAGDGVLGHIQLGAYDAQPAAVAPGLFDMVVRNDLDRFHLAADVIEMGADFDPNTGGAAGLRTLYGSLGHGGYEGIHPDDQGNILIKAALDTMKALPNYASEILPTFAPLTTDASSRVVAFNVFYAGGNGGVWNYGLWPHSWSLANVGPQDLSPGGKKVWEYQISNIGSNLELGTFCHESGHLLCGFPDIYDYDSGVGASSGGAGRFCLMNSGGHGGNPVQICAYLKRAAGWAA